jgi:hypothetical protein
MSLDNDGPDFAALWKWTAPLAGIAPARLPTKTAILAPFVRSCNGPESRRLPFVISEFDHELPASPHDSGREKMRRYTHAGSDANPGQRLLRDERMVDVDQPQHRYDVGVDRKSSSESAMRTLYLERSRPLLKTAHVRDMNTLRAPVSAAFPNTS